MHRFFVSHEITSRQPVVLGGAPAHQMRAVLRLLPGAQVALLDNTGLVHTAEITAYHGGEAHCRVLHSGPAGGEPGLRITLYQAVLKGERFNWALQKGTEIGVSRFVPVISQRTVVAGQHDIEHKRARWERIIQEAAEQSGRGRLPELAPSLAFHEAVGRAAARAAGEASWIGLIPWEGERAAGLREVLATCNLCRGACIEVFVGPEGGFTEEEVELARSHGIRPVSLGPRILRAETAGLVTAAAILYEAGDLAPEVS